MKAITVFQKMRCSKCGCDIPDDLAAGIVQACVTPICSRCWSLGIYEYCEEHLIMPKLLNGSKEKLK